MTLQVKCFSFLASFRSFPYPSIFCSLKYMRTCRSGVFVSLFLHLPYLMFSKLSRSVVWCLTLIWRNSWSLLFQLFSCSFLFSFWYSYYSSIKPFVVVWIFCSIPSQSLVYLLLGSCDILLRHPQTQSLPSAMTSLLKSHWRHSSFHSVCYLYHFFFFFLRILISLLILSFCSYVLSTLLIRAQHINHSCFGSPVWSF